MNVELSGLFTDAVRRVAPLAQEKKLACSFDWRGPGTVARCDAAAMQSSLHRLLCAALDLVEVGFLVFYAETRLLRPRKCQLVVKAAGTGLLASEARIAAVLDRLLMVEDGPPVHGGRPRLHRAQGVCPSTGANVQFASLPSEGALFSVEWLLPVDTVHEPAAGVDANQARAWVIHDDEVAAQSLVRRLQRLGWATTIFDAPAPAARRLRALAPSNARPALLIAMESAAVSPSSVQALRADLPAGTQAVYGALAGSPTLGRDGAVPGFAVSVHPFSPGELRAMTQWLSPARADASGQTRPAPLSIDDRPTLQVVDDNEIARVAAAGLASSLGYDVGTAANGMEAIEQCRRLHPAVVLMDLELPRMEGIRTARWLRELERAGSIAPCRIIASTADSDAATERVCKSAGMDGHLAKPLSMPLLRAELRRLCASPSMSASPL